MLSPTLCPHDRAAALSDVEAEGATVGLVKEYKAVVWPADDSDVPGRRVTLSRKRQ